MMQKVISTSIKLLHFTITIAAFFRGFNLTYLNVKYPTTFWCKSGQREKKTSLNAHAQRRLLEMERVPPRHPKGATCRDDMSPGIEEDHVAVHVLR